GSLIEIVALPTSENDDNPYIVAFYGSAKIRNPTQYQRTYAIKAWRYKSNASMPDWSTNVFGWLSAVDIYEVSKEGIKGFYFTNDGNIKQKDFEIEDITIPRRPCVSFQTFIGCPMPFCFDNRFDASMTVNENGAATVYLMKGQYFWKINATSLPMPIPKVDKAFNSGYTPINRALKRKEKLVYCCAGDKSKGNFPCIPMFVGAAFAHIDKDNTTTAYMYELIQNSFCVIRESDENNEEKKSVFNPFEGKHGVTADAMWYNNFENRVYIFLQDSYMSYKYENGKWIDLKNGSLYEFGILDRFVDSVVNIGGNGYFFTNTYFYEVPESDWKSAKRRARKLSFIDFFRVRSECYFNDVNEFDSLTARYGFHKHSVSSKTDTISHRTTTTTEKRISGSTLAAIIIMFAFLVTSCMMLFFCWCSNRNPNDESDDKKKETFN
ncbi:hypothetical protein B4U80_14202, partial [Leptotrombidium deliense]